jgi:hypothetical protein
MNILSVSATALRNRASALALAGLFGLSFGLAGCTGNVGAPGAPGTQATALVSSGVVQGYLRDRLTNQAIVGAVIDIGTSKATTDSEGAYRFTDLPVPADALNQSVVVSYKVGINMRSVTAPVNMTNAAATPRFADEAIETIDVEYTHPFAGSGAASSPIPVTGLVADMDLYVARLASTITGVVSANGTLAASGVGTIGNDQPVGAGYIVNLISNGSNISSGNDGAEGATTGTGAAGNTATSTVTDANGSFSFTNVESARTFTIQAFNAAQTISGSNTSVTTTGYSRTTVVGPQLTTATRVRVANVDVIAPVVSTITPQTGSDLNAAVAQTVVFTFSEPIKNDVGASEDPSVVGSLYNAINVTLNGRKAVGDVPYAIDWDQTYTQLTVRFTQLLAASSRYTVNLGTASLRDLAGNALASPLTQTVSFTTFGTPAAEAPTLGFGTIGILFNNVTAGSAVPVLDWVGTSASVTKYYEIYRADNISAAGTSAVVATTGYRFMASQVGSTASDDIYNNPSYFANAATTTTPFSVGENKLTYTYAVRAVNFDNIPSSFTTGLLVSDTVAGSVSSISAVGTTATILFTEPVTDLTASSTGSYTYSGGTVTKALLNASGTQVTLTLSPAVAPTNTVTASSALIRDIAGNIMAGSAVTVP